MTPPAQPRMSIPKTAVVVTAATLAAAIAGGATDVVFPAGEHGVVAINAIAPANGATIWCDPAAHFERITFGKGSANLSLIAPRAWPDKTAALLNGAVIQSDVTTSNIVVFRADVRGHVTGADYAKWTLAEWKLRETFGIILAGKYSLIRECRGLGLRIAWTINGGGSEITGCTALGLSEDGVRIVGDGTDFSEEDNYFGDYVTTTNGARHPDAIVQAWSKAGSAKPGVAGMLDNVRIRNNVAVELIEASGIAGLNGLAADHPLRIAPQGIGFHDGAYSNLNIQKNRIWTSAWTGINVNLKRGTGADISGNECYDLQGRKDHVKITATGSGITATGNTAGLQNYGAGQAATPIDYSKAPKPPAPPIWDQWAA